MARRHSHLAADGEHLAMTCYTAGTSPSARLLSLHGAGSADRTRVAYICDVLSNRGIECTTFDFSGHGESTGQLSESSLKRRVAQARIVAEQIEGGPTILLGTSMGGHIALELLPYLHRITHLIFFCPALYGRKAYEKPFDHRFSREIRQDNSFEDAPALEGLRKFRGNVLVFFGSDDQVIPERVINIYTDIASRPNGERILLRGAEHALHSWANLTQANRNAVILPILYFLT